MRTEQQQPPPMDRAFSQLMELLVNPEIKNRQANGSLPEGFQLSKAQILFFPDGTKPKVRLNDEVKALVEFKLKKGISKKRGEFIYENEIDWPRSVKLTEDDDPDCGHALLFKIGSNWFIGFDLRYNKGFSKRNIETAEQFYESAQFSLEKNNLRAFIDNLFSAVELTAKAELLLLPDPKFKKAKKHKSIQTRYNWYVKVGNAQPKYRDALNKLSKLRYPARYLNGKLSISSNEARKLLTAVKSMIDDVKSYVR